MPTPLGDLPWWWGPLGLSTVGNGKHHLPYMKTGELRAERVDASAQWTWACWLWRRNAGELSTLRLLHSRVAAIMAGADGFGVAWPNGSAGVFDPGPPKQTSQKKHTTN